MKYKKLLDKNNPDNTVVSVVFRDDKKRILECSGVLIREGADSMRVVLNAKDDKAYDYLDINLSEILNIKVLTKSEIVELK